MSDVIHRRFQYNVSGAGGIEVQFDIEFNGQDRKVKNIKIHQGYKTDDPLPKHPEIRYYDGHYAFYVTFEAKEGTKYQYIKNPLVSSLIERIMDIANAEKPPRRK